MNRSSWIPSASEKTYSGSAAVKIEISKILLDQAKIAEGESISDPAFYVSKLSDYILKAMA